MNKSTFNRRSERGFTLIELGIAMVIISLLITGILAGQNLIRTASLKAAISQFNEFQSVYNVFVEKYLSYPGDFSRADDFIGVGGTEVGNGNSRIEWSVTGGGGSEREGPLAWYHLQRAGLIDGSFGTNLTSGNGIPGDVVPRSEIGGDAAGFYMSFDGTAGTGLGNFLGMGLYDGSGAPDNVVINAEDAHDIDRKIDDGFPTLGLMRSIQVNASECYNTATPPEFILTNNQVYCHPHYKLD